MRGLLGALKERIEDHIPHPLALDMLRVVVALIDVDEILDENDMANRYAEGVHAPDDGHRECIDAERLREAVLDVLLDRK